MSTSWKAPALPARNLLVSGLALGIAGDDLLRAPGGPGLNLLILYTAFAASAVYLTHSAGARIRGHAGWLLLAGLACATGVVWRGSEPLQVLCVLGAGSAVALAAFRPGVAWLRRTGVVTVVHALGASSLHGVLGAARLIRSGGPQQTAVQAGERDGWRRTGLVLRGAALATPALVVFGALLGSADAVFAALLDALVRFDPSVIISHMAVVTVLSWGAVGLLGGFVTGTRVLELDALRVGRPRLTALEVGTALLLVDVLFLAFVAVQFRYLFGGASLVEVTPGLTYAEYAREGFFQLVIAAALALPCLLAADWLMDDRDPRARRVFVALGGLQVSLLLAVVASAFARMGAYLGAFGLTEARFFATAWLIWLAWLFLWFAATVLRGRRERFVLGGVAWGFALLGGLVLANPDAMIARVNVARVNIARAGGFTTEPAEALQAGTPTLDALYLTSLSSDAVPTLVADLEDLPAEARCIIARRILRRWGEGDARDWRSWNWSDARAREAVRGADGALWGWAGDRRAEGWSSACA